MTHANTTRHVNRYLEKSRRKTKGTLNEDEEGKGEDSTYHLPTKNRIDVSHYPETQP